ncbi:MAG: peptidoglycan peptidase [Proteobacteria bacterium]|nr:peptidoglycan peptidase [Pseudomonadota bacterium]
MKKKIFLGVVMSLFLLAVMNYLWLETTRAQVEKLPVLKSGDLVFQTINTGQTLAVAAASASAYTHVGIVKIDENGTALVVEAVGPVREVPLEKWLRQGIFDRVAVMRLNGLTEKQAEKILKAAEKYYGRPYDFFFLFDKEKIYCSELVYYAFKEGADIDIGKIQKVSELHIDNFAVRNLIKQRWQKYKPCRQQKAGTFSACLPVILSQELITPTSVANDPRAEMIYKNYMFRW